MHHVVFFIGIPLGIVVSMILSGVLGNAGGWPLVFYFFGGVTILFIFPWYFLAFDFPDTHPRISEAEKIYILNGTGKGNEESDEIKVSMNMNSTFKPITKHVIYLS